LRDALFKRKHHSTKRFIGDHIMSLNYEFPQIRHIDDVVWAIDDNFRVVEKNGLTFINYNMMGNDVFPDVIPSENQLGKRIALRAALRRECRGIVFDTATGVLVSRPYHKFFNVGEREDMLTIDVTAEHVVLEKLDGSMIRPLPAPGGLRWGTKMGITDVAMLAEEFCADKPQYAAYAAHCMEVGATPIFEFGSRRSRVVVDFPEEVMVLLDVRHNISGTYVSREVIHQTAAVYGIPVVDHVNFRGKLVQGMFSPPFSNWAASFDVFVEGIRSREDGEGKVIAWANGHRAKIKSDHYVRIHRAKDMIRSERRVLELILAEGMDDLIPILDETDKVRILNYIDKFSSEVSRRVGDLQSAYARHRRMFETKKDFAIAKDPKTLNYPAWTRSATFSLWDGKVEDERAAVMRVVQGGMSSEGKFAEMKAELGLNTGWFDSVQEDAA
jgi:RNA ligase